ncbi:hypothetical protein GQ568_02110 [Patescibacteria group bacterium]|nr:hypothetical protein [Patescibacteria group bacterium]
MNYIIVGILGLTILLAIFLCYMGFFRKIEITEKETGPYKIVFEGTYR